MPVTGSANSACSLQQLREVNTPVYNISMYKCEYTFTQANTGALQTRVQQLMIRHHDMKIMLSVGSREDLPSLRSMCLQVHVLI